MRATSVIGLLALLGTACGGVAATDKANQGAQPPDVAAAGSGGARIDASPDGQIQVVDDVDEPSAQSPMVPPGSSAFFWKGGLGNWFVSASDGSATHDATTADVIPPRGDNTRAYHVSETNAGTAVDLWAQLNHPQGRGVDLGPYSGVAFWARLNGSSGALTVAFGANGKFANIAALPQKVVPISSDWAQFFVRFDDLGVDTAAVSSIDFVVGAQSAPIELWVDDLALLCRSACP